MQARPSRLQRCEVTAEADGPKDSRMVSPPPKLITRPYWFVEEVRSGCVALGRVVDAMTIHKAKISRPLTHGEKGGWVRLEVFPLKPFYHFPETEAGDP